MFYPDNSTEKKTSNLNINVLFKVVTIGEIVTDLTVQYLLTFGKGSGKTPDQEICKSLPVQEARWRFPVVAAAASVRRQTESQAKD